MKKLLFIAILILPVIAVFSQNSLISKEINVFKNGTYYIMKEGSLAVKNGYATIETPETPLLSTFWVNSTKDLNVKSIVFITDTIKKPKPPASYYDFLSSNKGKKIKILYRATEKDLREVSGTLQEFYKTTGLIRIKQQDNKITFIPISGVTELNFEDNPVDVVMADSITRLAKIYFDKPNTNADVRICYMQTGIQWMPSYNIRIVNEKELQLEMKALVENYAEAVENAQLTLTVGNPQFYFGLKTDPLSTNFLTDLRGGTASRVSSDNMFVAQMYSNAYYAEEATASGDINSYYDYETEGEKTNDLYMYKIGNASLPYQSKTSFQIFAVKASYKDVYEVSINDVANYSYYSYISNDPEARYDVYHSLLITNGTNFPFTTGPVLVQNENLQPLAQDQIKYTPTGGNVSVQLSKAGDVVVKNTEEEKTKADNVKKIGKTYYNKVTIKGTIYLENLQDKKIQLNVKKNLTATVLQASDNGNILKSGKYNALNPYSIIEWEIPLNSKEKKNITYEYEVYVSSYD